MTDATLAMLERWQGTDSPPLDIPVEMMRLTLRVAGLTLFNLDLSDDSLRLQAGGFWNDSACSSTGLQSIG